MNDNSLNELNERLKQLDTLINQYESKYGTKSIDPLFLQEIKESLKIYNESPNLSENVVQSDKISKEYLAEIKVETDQTAILENIVRKYNDTPTENSFQNTTDETPVDHNNTPVKFPFSEIIESPREVLFKESASTSPLTINNDDNVDNYSLRVVESLESLIAGNWFYKIGIIVIILGIIFYLHEAAIRGWLPPFSRISMGSILGLGLITLGDRLRTHKYSILSQSLIGSGIAVLYVVIFVAFSMYQIIGISNTLVLLFTVNSLSLYLSAKHDAIIISILVLFGGFLTHNLLLTKVDNEIGLFIGIALLDIGVISTAYYKRWRELNIPVFVLTLVMFTGWINLWYEPSKFRSTIFFLTFFFAIFALLVIFHKVINRVESDALDIIIIFINAIFYFTACYKLIHPTHYDRLGLFTLSLSAFNFVLGYFIYCRYHNDKYLLYTFVGIGIVFLTMAIPLQLDKHWTTIGLATEGAALCWIGYKMKNKYTQCVSIPILLMALIHWFNIDFILLGYKCSDMFLPVFNKNGLSAFILISALAITYYCFRKTSEESKKGEGAAEFIIMGATILGFTWLTADLLCNFHLVFDKDIDLQLTGLTYLWAILAGTLLIVGAKLKSYGLKLIALTISSMVLLKVIIFNVLFKLSQGDLNDTSILNQYTWNHLILCALLILTAYIYSHSHLVRSIMIVIANFFGVSLLSYESALFLKPNTVMAFSIAWGVYGGVLLLIGIFRKIQLLRYISFFLLVTTTLKILFIDMVSLDAVYRVASFIVVGAMLIATSFLYKKRYRKQTELLDVDHNNRFPSW